MEITRGKIQKAKKVVDYGPEGMVNQHSQQDFREQCL